MRDLVHFAELLRAKLRAEGHTCTVLWGRDAAIVKDNQGPGTANRVVVYDGPPDEETGTWVRHGTDETKAQKREEPGMFFRWQRVTLDVWGYNGSPGNVALDGGKEEAAQFRAKDYLCNAVERNAYKVLAEQGHAHHTFYQDTVDNRTSPSGRRHGDRAVFSFEIAFLARDPAPTVDKFVEATPILTGEITTPIATITEVTP